MTVTRPVETPIIIAIAGGSCSGKTTLAQYLRGRLGQLDCLLIRQDDYYFDIRSRVSGTAIPNFDVPEAIDFAQLAQDLAALKSGNDVYLPNYDFTTHQRLLDVTPASPTRFILVEGLLLLTDSKLRALFDHSLYLRCSEPIRFSRRLSRDVAERGRSVKFVTRQFETEVSPAHDTYISPSMKYAAEVIEQAEYCDQLETLAARLIEIWTHGSV